MEVPVASIKDLYTSLKINKDIIQELVESQQAVSPQHMALKTSLLRLNHENKMLI